MYKVTDVSAPALRPTSSYNGLLCENTVFAVWLCDSLTMISRPLCEALWDKHINIYCCTNYPPNKKDCVCSQCTLGTHSQ